MGERRRIEQSNVEYLMLAANAGVDVRLGSLKFRIPTSAPRSMQISTVSGTATLKIQNEYNGGNGSGTGLITLNITTTPSYVNSLWTFGPQGMWQDVIILHVGENKMYRVRMEVGAGYNNNTFAGYRI